MTAWRLALLVVLLPAFARAGEIDAAHYMRQLADRALTELTAPMPPGQRVAGVRRLLDEDFDLGATGRFALGRVGRGAGVAERGRFQSAFEDWMVRTVAGGLEGYDGGTIRFHPARPGADGVTIVPSEYVANDGSTFKIDWTLRPERESWRIADFTIEGMGFGMLLRSGINAAAERTSGGLDGLISRLGGFADIAKRR